MKVNLSGSPAAPGRAIGRLGRPRLLIVGCGDIGLRIVARLHRRFRVVALTSSPLRVPLLRAAGAVALVGNLDDRTTLARLRGFGARVIHLAPRPSPAPTRLRTEEPNFQPAFMRHGRTMYHIWYMVKGARPALFIYPLPPQPRPSLKERPWPTATSTTGRWTSTTSGAKR